MGSVGTSGVLTRSALAVVRRRAPLLAIPLTALVVATATVAATATLGQLSLAAQVREYGSAYRTTGFGLPGPTGSSANTVTTIVPTPLTALVLVAGALVLALTFAFASAAVTAATHATLTGGRPSIPRALGIAFVRAPQLLAWVVFGAVVGVPQRLLEKRPVLGALPARLTGIAWRWAAWVVVPVIVVEGPGPRRALHRSGELVDRTWGPHVVARTGIGWTGVALAAPGVALAALLGARFGPLGTVPGAVWVALAGSVTATVSGVARTALYLHATGHDVPGFAAAELTAAFEPAVPIDGPRRSAVPTDEAGDEAGEEPAPEPAGDRAALGPPDPTGAFDDALPTDAAALVLPRA